MTASQYLRFEHRRIEELLAALSAAALDVEATGRAPAFTADLLDMLVEYAEVGHHAKEEALLFPALALHGVGPDGLVEAMAHQHQMGRVHVRDMRRALEAVRAGDPAAREAFAASADAYIELLRVHIQIEDDDLYPLAERLFDPEEDRRLVAEFRAVDTSVNGTERLARCEALLARVLVQTRP